MFIKGASGNTSLGQGTREVPVDVPPTIDPKPEKINFSSRDSQASNNSKHFTQIENKLHPTPSNFQKPPNLFNKNPQSNSSLEKLKHLAKFGDLKSSS